MRRKQQAPRRRPARLGPSEFVRWAIRRTIQLAPTYWGRTLRQRAGRRPSGAVNLQALGTDHPDLCAAELEALLRSVAWRPYHGGALRRGARAFRCHLPGCMRIVYLRELPAQTTVQLDDRKETGYWSCVVGRSGRGRSVATTVLLTGRHRGRSNLVLTFHPGPPVPPSGVRCSAVRDRVLTAEAAIRLGFVTAKVARTLGRPAKRGRQG